MSADPQASLLWRLREWFHYPLDRRYQIFTSGNRELIMRGVDACDLSAIFRTKASIKLFARLKTLSLILEPNSLGA
jgi:hypothetical protein